MAKKFAFVKGLATGVVGTAAAVAGRKVSGSRKDHC